MRRVRARLDRTPPIARDAARRSLYDPRARTHPAAAGMVRPRVRESGFAPSRVASAMTAPKLLDQVCIAVRRKHFSLRTEEGYVSWTRRFVLYPRDVGGAGGAPGMTPQFRRRAGLCAESSACGARLPGADIADFTATRLLQVGPAKAGIGATRVRHSRPENRVNAVFCRTPAPPRTGER